MVLTTAIPKLFSVAIGVLVSAVFLALSPASFAQNSFAGVYTGTFSGPADNGQFAVLLRTNGSAIVMAYDAYDQIGFVNENVAVNPNGTFSHSNIDGDGTSGSGAFTASGVSGVFVDSRGFTGTFVGTKEPATGWARDIGGFYSDTFSWEVRINGIRVGTYSGLWTLLVAADGTLFQLIEATLDIRYQGQTVRQSSEDGQLGMATSIAQICSSGSVPGFSFTCSFDPNSYTFSGTVFASSSGVTISGSYALVRREPLPDFPPVAADDAYRALMNKTLVIDSAGGVLANDSDPEGDPLSAALVSGPAHGTVNLNADGSFTYTPNENFVGLDSFSYRARARSLPSNAATVSIDVKHLALPWLSILLE